MLVLGDHGSGVEEFAMRFKWDRAAPPTLAYSVHFLPIVATPATVKVANVGSLIRKLLFCCTYCNCGKVHHEVLWLPKRIQRFQSGQCFTNRLLIFFLNQKFCNNLVVHICCYAYEEQGMAYFVVLCVASMNTSSKPYRKRPFGCGGSSSEFFFIFFTLLGKLGRWWFCLPLLSFPLQWLLVIFTILLYTVFINGCRAEWSGFERMKTRSERPW